MEERLQKLMARAGLGSRRSCEDLIEQGRVTVNGKRAALGQKADPSRDHIAVDGEPLESPERFIYILLHKPRGVVSSLSAQGDRQTVRDLVPFPGRLYPVGRLDIDSEGLILLTNDGALTDRLTHPRYESEKEYRVLVRGEPRADQLETWRRGVMLEGSRTAPALVQREGRAHGSAWLRLVMHEGRKHQIRDIGRLLGLPVQRLIRVRMGGLALGDLALGQWRELRPEEVKLLRAPAKAVPAPARATRRPPRPAGRPRPSRNR
ncbi:MAG: rRNA pseudouridine synthase [Anaerolineales bacterium]|nr:rRNA pseudouridine synthase [Anaerolineales bacterium]